jgi:hypothetical protein
MPIGPVSETGRAMMASLQQAMSKGMPVDQAIAYVKGMATQGVAPMTDLYSMLNQFQRLKQPKVQAPQTPPTLKDQLGQLSQAQDVIDRGVGSLPAPVMEQAKFAGGGIVAFDDGGFITAPRPVDPSKPRDPKEQTEAEKFRLLNMDKLGYDPYMDDKAIGRTQQEDLLRNYALQNVMKDPAAIGAGLGGLLGGPIGIPVGGYLGGYLGRVIGNGGGDGYRGGSGGEGGGGGSSGKAGGGIVAFAGGGISGIDFSKMTMEELDQLTNDPNPEVMHAARKELVGRFSASPSDIFAKYAEAFREGIEGPPAVRFSNERKFPSYMYDEKGNVRKGEVTGGIAGTRFYSSSNPPAKTKQAAPAAAKPSAIANQLPPTTTFDDMVTHARMGSDQGGTSYDTSTKDKGKEKDKGKSKGESDSLYKDLENDIPKEGTIGQYLEEVRKARGDNAAAKEYRAYLDRLEASGEAQDKQARNLAIAKAGFAMAEAAGRRGRDRTGFLGAAALGGSTYANEQGRIAQQAQLRQEKLAEAKFKLADAQRREDTDDIRAAMQEVKANQRAIAQARSDITKLRIAEKGQTNRANIAARSQELMAQRYAEQAEAAARSGDLRALAQLQTGILTELKDPFTNETDKTQLRGLLGQIRGRLGGSLGGGAITSGPQLGAIPDNILALTNKYR